MATTDIARAQRILQTLIVYARQPSTYRGLVYVLSAAGITLSPDHFMAIVAGMLLLNGLINVFRNEEKPKISPELVERAGEAMLRTYIKSRRSRRGPDTDRKRRPADAG